MTCSINTPRFPRELYDIVVNHCHDDIQTLKNVALVDRASAHICQPYIFHQVTLKTQRTQHPTPATATPCFRLHDIILSSPHLATYIKDLTVDDREPSDYDLEKYPFVTFVADNKFLPAILDVLPYITGIKLLLDSPTWFSLNLPLRFSIERAFTSRNLLDVTMLAIRDVPLFLFRKSRLHRLCLLHTSIMPALEPDPHGGCQLETLDLIVDDPREILDEITPFNLTHLQRISIAIGLSLRNDLRPFASLLKNNSRTLNYLGLHIFEKPPSPQAMNLGCLTSLRHLLIDIPTWIKRDMIQYLAHVLQNMDASGPVETITILIIVSEECTLHNWEDAAQWQALDVAFSRLTSTTLVEVKIQVHSNEGRLEDITGLDLIERGLPGLVSRGILEVEKIPDLPAPYIT